MMTEENQTQSPPPILLGGIGIILLLISIYTFNNYFFVRYPIIDENTQNFFLQFEMVSKYISVLPFFGSPNPAIALSFSLIFISYLIIDSENYRRSAIYVIVLNILFSFFFCIEPLIEYGEVSILHFFYLVLSLVPAIFFRKNFFGKPNSPIIVLIPIIFIVLTQTSNKIELVNSANNGITQANVAMRVNGQKAYPTPMPEEHYWIFTTGNGFENARLRGTLFTSLKCKECKEIYPLIEKLKQKYAGTLSLQFIPFPHSNSCNPAYRGIEGHEDECHLARWALCNGNSIFPQAFEAMMKAPNFKSSHNDLLAMARRSGKQDCYNLKRGFDLLDSMVAKAANYNIMESPVLMVNGIIIPKPYTFENVRPFLNELLRRAF